MRKNIYVILLSISIVFSIAGDLFGIPAFARKHKLSCKTCHNPYPKLKPFGEEFAADGFTIRNTKNSRYFRDTGDDKLSLLRSFPFAVRMDSFITFNKSGQSITDFSMPFNIKLLSGGSIAKNISYYFYFFFSERGKIVGLEDAFIMFNNVFNTGISLTVGQFQISDPLFKRELRLTYEDYYIYKSRPGVSNLNLTYDRGFMLNYTFSKGGPDISLEILNGSGIEEADEFKNFDSDKYKNIFGKISQNIGKHITIGAEFFIGKESPINIVNSVKMIGVDLSLNFGNTDIIAQYLKRNDDNPWFLEENFSDIKTEGGFVEISHLFSGTDERLYAIGLFNWIESEQDILDYRSVALHLEYLIRRNIKVLGEIDMISKSSYGKYSRLLIGLVTAF